MKKYKTIVVDPPWDLTIGKARTKAGSAPCGWYATDGRRKELAENYKGIHALQYQVMTVEEIAALPVSAVADKAAHLYVWTINKYVEQTYDIVRAWGFKPSTLLTWCKAPMGLGLGGTYGQATEHILFARRGTCKALRRVDSTWWQWKRGRHSAKPEAFQDMVETVSPGPYLELFARRQRPGWDVWGDEVECTTDLSSTL